MIKAKAPERIERELTPAGMQVARCYSMVHIGTVQWEYMGEKKRTDKVRLTFELPHEMRVFNEENGEQPMVISKEYTLSMYEKANLRQDLENWRGKSFTPQEADDFDITKLIGVPCMLNITHDKAKKNDNVYANIGSINPLMKGMECPAQINPSFEFNYEEKFDSDWVNNQPEFIRTMIVNTPEYQAKMMSTDDKSKLDKLANEGFDQAPPPPVDSIPVEEYVDDSTGLPF